MTLCKVADKEKMYNIIETDHLKKIACKKCKQEICIIDIKDNMTKDHDGPKDKHSKAVNNIDKEKKCWTQLEDNNCQLTNNFHCENCENCVTMFHNISDMETHVKIHQEIKIMEKKAKCEQCEFIGLKIHVSKNMKIIVRKELNVRVNADIAIKDLYITC